MDERELTIRTALNIYRNYDVTMEQAMSIALENENSTLNYNPYRVPTSQREYGDLQPGYQRVLMQGILKWIEDYNRLPDGEPRQKLGKKIYNWINFPPHRNILMKSGYWSKVPEEIKGMKAAKMQANYEARSKAPKKSSAPKKNSKVSAEEAATCDMAMELMFEYGLTADEAFDAAEAYMS